MKRFIYTLTFIATVCQAQFTQLGNKLVGTGSIGSANQGIGASISGDGKTAVVTGYMDNGGIGAAWIYTFNGTNFVQFGSKLVGSNYTGTPEQGWSTSISANGKRVVVGGIYDNSIGAVWVYSFNGTAFVQAGSKLVGSGATTNGNQGFSVSISADGNTIIVGGAHNDGSVGAAWIYTFNGSNFVQVGSKLFASDNVGASNQGSSVSISADGKTAMVGGRWDNSNIGAAWIYTFNGTNFVQAGNKLVGTGNVGASWQGNSVSLSADGKTAVAGGTSDNSNQGAVWVFTFNGTNFVQLGNKFTGAGGINVPAFGLVSTSADGKIIMVGGANDNTNVGALWVYTFNGTNYAQAGSKLLGTGGIGANLGYPVSISEDGQTAIAGGIHDNSDKGAAWIFVNTTTSCNVDLQSGLIAYYPFNGNANDETGIGNNGTVIGASLTSDRFGISSSAYSFNGTSDNIYIGTTVGNFGLSDFTISLWMKAQANQIDYSALFSKQYWSSTTNFLNFEFAQSTGGYLSGDINQDTDPSFYRAIKGNTPILDNVWHNCILMRKNGKIMFYTDGLLSYSDITTGTGIVNLDNTNRATLGARTSFGSLVHFYNGNMDDIKIYNRALNDCEIISLYNETTTTVTGSCITITNVSISGPSIISNCSIAGFSAVSYVSGSYNWATPTGTISDYTSATTSVSWITPGIYPLSITVFNECSTVTSAINVTVNSNLIVTSINKPIIGRNENNLIVNNTISGVNYQWLLNSTIEPGQNSYIHTSSLMQGTYQVSASSLANCTIALSDLRDVLPITEVVTITNYEIRCVTAINDLQKSSVEVYPNPGSGLFNLRSENIIISTIEVFNGQGQMVYNKPFNNTIDLTKQPSGIYLIRLYDQLGILAKTTRIIIE